jgi:hypothetical protein
MDAVGCCRHPLPAVLRERLERTLHIEETVGGRMESSCVGCLNLLCVPVCGRQGLCRTLTAGLV